MTPERAIETLEKLCGFFEDCETDAVAIKKGIEALEYRTPKKPECENLVNSMKCECSKCNALVRTLFVGNCDKPLPPFCEWCGQALDWSDEE